MQAHLLPQSECSCRALAVASSRSLLHLTTSVSALSTGVSSKSVIALPFSRQPEAQRRGLTLQLSSSSRDSPSLESSDTASIGASNVRPWSFDLPSMGEMRTDVHWIQAVADWELFWVRHTVWQDYVSYSRRRTAKPRPQHEQWWELDTPDAESRKKKVTEVQEVLDIVADRTREIVNMGVPIPEHIPFNLDNVIPKDHNRKLHSATQLNMFALGKETMRERAELSRPHQDEEKPYWEQPPWLRFDKWDFRAYVEKKRKAEAMRKDFMKRQAHVSKYRSMNVSPMTDARVRGNYIIQTGEEPVRHTHEEIMDLITNGGKSVHPSKVHYRVKDPLEKVDWFQAGAHSIPETEDFLRMIGHFADNDHDLHAFEEEEAPSSTLNENFEDFEAMPADGNAFMSDQGMDQGPAAGQDAPAGGQDADESYGDGDAEE